MKDLVKDLSKRTTFGLRWSLGHHCPGKISIFLDVTDGRRYKLIVGDNGIGIKDDVSLDKPTSMGLQLIKILVDQIDGEIERRDQKGTVFMILFKGLGNDRII